MSTAIAETAETNLVLDTIDREVKEHIVKRNGDIVVRALEMLRQANSGTVCNKCQYIPNCEIFDSLVAQYTIARQERLIVKEEGRVRRIITLKAQWGHDVYDMYDTKPDPHYQAIRDLIKRYWPCERCMKLYNPTMRRKHGDKLDPRTAIQLERMTSLL